MGLIGWRILATGSRGWADRSAVGRAMLLAIHDIPAELVVPDGKLGSRVLWERITLVHGGARGTDPIAASLAAAWGMAVEAHPADWARHGRAAGPIRNTEMVKLGADVCIAFPLGLSRGTRHCMRLAEAAGIPIIVGEIAGQNGGRSECR